jgi:molecular chaperone GrpE
MNDEILDKKNGAAHNDDTEVIPDEEAEDPKTALRRLREKLKECSKERQEYLTGWQRARADFTNAKREEESRREALIAGAKFDFLSELIVIIDSLDMALKLEAGDGEVWKAGMEQIRSQSLSVLRRHGVVPFEPMGEIFNPAEHESVAVMAVVDESESDRILEVLQRGYRSEERIVRPAKVKIGSYETQ